MYVNNKDKRIIASKDSQFKIKIEDISDFNGSFFKNIYEDAAMNVMDIIKNNEDYYPDKSNSRLKYIDKEGKNNIIAFAGERGAGKTSAMISFANALQSEKKTLFSPMEKLLGKKFWVIDPIDPSIFECNESIFQVILAKLFESFKSEIEKENLRGEEQVKIIRLFDKVYKNFKTISLGSKWIDSISLDDTLEGLNSLAASSSMRENFMKLVNDLLTYKFGRYDIKNSYLVLSIDDLDMNISKASDIAEQIRKYLMIPNIIVLISIKVEQLTDSIEQMFRKEYDIMLNRNQTLEDNPKSMANRYIEKLIPNGRKLYLPNFTVAKNLDDVKIEIKDTNENIKGIQECLLGLIYRKTGLLFVKPIDGVHYLIPDNMRELQNIIAILTKLEDLVPREYNEYDNFRGVQYKNLDGLRKNVNTFEKYFYSIWMKKNLDNKYISVINQLISKVAHQKNKFIIGKIAECKLDNTTIINRLKIEDFEDYIDIKNNSYNVSLGDVLDVLNINKEYDTEEIQKFKFAIKTCYSIEIHKRLYFKEYNLEKNNYTKGIDDIYRIVGGNPLGNVLRTGIRNAQARNNDFNKNRNEWSILNYNQIPIFIYNKNIEGAITCDLSSLVKFLYPSKNMKEDKVIDELIESINEQNENKLYDIRTYIYDNMDNFRRECMESIRLLHAFIYPGCNKNDLYRKDEQTYYDIDVNIGTGFGSHQNALFALYAPLTRLIKEKRIDEGIYSGRIALLKNDNIKEYNNLSYITIPYNSIEALEFIAENYKINIMKAMNGKDLSDKDTNYFNEAVVGVYTTMKNTIESLINNVRYINKSEIDYGIYILNQFIKAPVIRNLLGYNEVDKDYLNLNLNITQLRRRNIESYIFMTNTKNIISKINDLIYDLNTCNFKRVQGRAPSISNIKKKVNILYDAIEEIKNIRGTKLLNTIEHYRVEFEYFLNGLLDLYGTEYEIKGKINGAVFKKINKNEELRYEIANELENLSERIINELINLREMLPNVNLLDGDEIIYGL